jgi:hypothetical protein
VGAAENELHAGLALLEGRRERRIRPAADVEEERKLVDDDESPIGSPRTKDQLEERSDVGEFRSDAERTFQDRGEGRELVSLGSRVADEDVGVLAVGELAEQPALAGAAPPVEEEREGIALVFPPPGESCEFGLAIDEFAVVEKRVAGH